MDPVSDDATAPCLIWPFFMLLPRTGVLHCFLHHGLDPARDGSLEMRSCEFASQRPDFPKLAARRFGLHGFLGLSHLDWTLDVLVFTSDDLYDMHTVLAKRRVSCLFSKIFWIYAF